MMCLPKCDNNYFTFILKKGVSEKNWKNTGYNVFTVSQL